MLGTKEYLIFNASFAEFKDIHCVATKLYEIYMLVWLFI